MKYRRDLFLCLTCLLLAFLFTMAGQRQSDEAMAARIAPEILRFHVLANSDSDEDQQLKLRVRTLLLDSIYEELGEILLILSFSRGIAAAGISFLQCLYYSTYGYNYNK